MRTTTDVAVVTGAASGIGAALARRLHQRGARLVLADIDIDSLQPLADELSAAAVPTDVADPDDMQRLASLAVDARLVCLNAGVLSTHPGAVWEAPHSEWQRVMGVNLGGVVNGLRAFVPQLLAENTPSHILITASLAGLLVWAGGGPYAASKHAVATVAQQAALALEGTHVGVTMLCPALVRSGMSPDGDDPLDIADAALAGVDAGRFLVMPSEWTDALSDRATRLGGGHYPREPQIGATG